MNNAIIESSPASPSAMLATPILGLLIARDEYIYSLETAPIEVFNAWVSAIITAEQINDPLALFIVKKHSDTWDDLARLWLIIDFQVRGIDVSKYAYANYEEACNQRKQEIHG